MLNLWYKNAVIYCVDVDAFMDSNADGIGDLRGLKDRLDHIEVLGANCVWLLPFFPSGGRDNGYDITDYYAVDPRFGTLGDFVDFVQAATDHGLRVIIDLVINHTSTSHPWFQAARKDPNSPFRDWYVWSKVEPPDIHEGSFFPGYQDRTWTYDEVAGEWYLHRFYDHQADLNTANPAVQEEIEKIMGFWLQLGISGFRVDAVPFVIEPKGAKPSVSSGDKYMFLAELNKFLSWRRAGAVLAAEADIKMDEAPEYFGNGDRMHLVFNFMLNQHIWLALAREKAEPIERILKKSPELPPTAQWVTFLRNHDELNLGRLTKRERQEVYDRFGPDPDMQIFDRGLRRRLAPMLREQDRIEMAFSLMFGLPATPMIWYGDELGQGEDLSLREREPVRMPMQWSNEKNGGFSQGDPGALVRPVVTAGDFSYPNVNVADQRLRHGSLLEQVGRLVRTRHACPEIGWGKVEIVRTGATKVLGLKTEWRGGCVLTLHNLSRANAEAKVDLLDDIPFEQLLGERCETTQGSVKLQPFGYAWYRLGGVRR